MGENTGYKLNTNGSAPLLDPAQQTLQLPGTPAPNLAMTLTSLALGSDGTYAYVDMVLDPGSIPYILLTSQDVSDPNNITLANAFQQFVGGDTGDGLD